MLKATADADPACLPSSPLAVDLGTENFSFRCEANVNLGQQTHYMKQAVWSAWGGG